MSKRSPASLTVAAGFLGALAAQPVRAAERIARIEVVLQPEPATVTNGALESDPPRQAVMLVEVD